jgi:transcription elongation factor/antiterminator RfaH
MSCNTDEPGNLSWYAVYTHPGQEERTSSNLKAWGIETFAPRIRERQANPFTGEPQYKIKPLFSRYIFARFDFSRLFHKLRYTRGVHSLVGFGFGPAPVDDHIIAIIQSKIGGDGFVKIGEPVRPGERVIIKDGPLKDFTGIFEREVKDSDRVVVLLNTISYQARVEVNVGSLSKFTSA